MEREISHYKHNEGSLSHTFKSHNYTLEKSNQINSQMTNEYEKISMLYRHIFSFSWTDDSIVKEKYRPSKYIFNSIFLVNLLTPFAFWFLINSMYFPSSFKPSIVQKEIFLLKLRKLIQHFAEVGSNLVKRTSSKTEKKELWNDLNSLKEGESTSLDVIEKSLKKEIEEISKINAEKIRNICLSNLLSNSLEFSKDFITKNSDGETYPILRDQILTNSVRENYFQKIQQEHLDQINKHQTRKHIFAFKEFLNNQESDEDTLTNCSVCNNGYYDESNYFITCSKCQISVHQSCYGIGTLPNPTEETWLCNACKLLPLEDVENIECILCPVKGGAMKQTTLKSNSLFVKFILKMREINQENTNISNLPTHSNSPSSSSEYNSVISFPNVYYDEMKEHFGDSFAWVHLSCVLWNPEIDLKNFSKKEVITNIDKIDRIKFEDICHICLLRNYGPTFKCKKENCNFKAHAECARLNGYGLEIVSAKDIVNIYNLIFLV